MQTDGVVGPDTAAAVRLSTECELADTLFREGVTPNEGAELRLVCIHPSTGALFGWTARRDKDQFFARPGGGYRGGHVATIHEWLQALVAADARAAEALLAPDRPSMLDLLQVVANQYKYGAVKVAALAYRREAGVGLG